ncbi:MAG: fatty acid desaturase, partial [Pseudomonadota bacterium]
MTVARQDHRTLIAGLTDDQRQSLCRQSDAPGLRRFAVHAGLVAATGTYIVAGAPLWWLAMPLQGALIVFLFTALHETIHGTAFRSEWLNTLVANVCGFLVILPPQHFRYFHLAHHRFTHDPDRDPELEGAKPRTLWDYLRYLSGVPDWVWRAQNIARNAVRENADPYVPDRARARVRSEAQRFAILYLALATASVTTESAALVFAWLLPILIGAPALRAYLLAEHARCPHVADMFQNTRTTLTNRLVRFFAWNMPFHAEHHAYPAVPFHRLPDLHRLT